MKVNKIKLKGKAVLKAYEIKKAKLRDKILNYKSLKRRKTI